MKLYHSKCLYEQKMSELMRQKELQWFKLMYEEFREKKKFQVKGKKYQK